MHRRSYRCFLQMGEGLDYEFVYIAPQELMLQYFYVSFLFGICVTIPVLLYQAWAFIRPGLEKKRKFSVSDRNDVWIVVFWQQVHVLHIRSCFRLCLYFFNTLSIGSGVSAYISVQNYLSFLADGTDYIWNCI